MESLRESGPGPVVSAEAQECLINFLRGSAGDLIKSSSLAPGWKDSSELPRLVRAAGGDADRLITVLKGFVRVGRTLAAATVAATAAVTT